MRGGRPHFASRRWGVFFFIPQDAERGSYPSFSKRDASHPTGTRVVLFSEHEENGQKTSHDPPSALGISERQSPADLPAGSGRSAVCLHSVAGSTLGSAAGGVGNVRCRGQRVQASRHDRGTVAQSGLDARGLQRRALDHDQEGTAENAKRAENIISAVFALSAVSFERELDATAPSSARARHTRSPRRS